MPFPGMEVGVIYRSFDRTKRERRQIYEQRRKRRRRRDIINTLGITLVILMALFLCVTTAVLIYSRDITSAQVAQTVAEGGETRSISFNERYYFISQSNQI